MKFLITYSTLYHIYYQISNSTLSLKLYKHIRIISRLHARALSLALKEKKKGEKKEGSIFNVQIFNHSICAISIT